MSARAPGGDGVVARAEEYLPDIAQRDLEIQQQRTTLAAREAEIASLRAALEKHTFLFEVLDLIAQAEMHDEVWWHQAGDKAPLIMVGCNDFFAWGCADVEPITPKNIHHLRSAITDCEAVPGHEGASWIGLLFCARSRGARPQGACYPKLPALIALFDACGEKRTVGLGNPIAHPDDVQAAAGSAPPHPAYPDASPVSGGEGETQP